MASAVTSKLIPEAELNEIMHKAETLWKKLYKPKSAYTYFTKACFQKAKSGEEGGSRNFGEMGKRWNEMSAADKKPFEEMCEADKVRSMEMQNAYDAYMQKVGPRLWDHDEEVERNELADKKNEMERRYQMHKVDAKRERMERSALVKSHKRVKTRRPKEVEDVARTRTSLPPKRPVAVDTETKRKQLSAGLDPYVWEVRESRTKPGMFYYFNKVDKTTQVSKPEVSAAQQKRLRSKSAPSVSGKTPRQRR